MDIVALHIESLIFTANPSISFDDIKSALEESLNMELSDQDLNTYLDTLMVKYASDDYAMEIVEVSGGLRFMTKGAYHHTVGTYLKQNTHKKLTKSALETLAIVAYKQPVTKTEIESIRGVNSDYTIQKLLEKDLVEITGRSSGPGKPLLYSTSQKFMDYFGLKSMEDMPKLKDFEEVENQIGEPEAIETEQNAG
ncbi:MAG: SMC-Scp complex subunit ScpB [Chitinophagales bacterium]|nr:SMC-Scp complex subunit ScpB [Chitinophagales bacterium]